MFLWSYTRTGRWLVLFWKDEDAGLDEGMGGRPVCKAGLEMDV